MQFRDDVGASLTLQEERGNECQRANPDPGELIPSDLVLCDPDGSANVRPERVQLPGWSAVTLINEACGYSFEHRPQRLLARSLAGIHDVAILQQ